MYSRQPLSLKFRYTQEELEGIAKIAEEDDLLVISDEVYEWHIVEPGKKMIRFGNDPVKPRPSIYTFLSSFSLSAQNV